MATVGKLLLLLGQLVWDWVTLGLRVRRILSNDLPHAERDRQEIRGLVETQNALLHDQIGFCRGVRESGECAPSPPSPGP